MHQYFEVMALALRTLKCDHFAFGVCSLKHDVISCSDFLTNFSYKSMKPYFVNVPGFKIITICFRENLLFVLCLVRFGAIFPRSCTSQGHLTLSKIKFYNNISQEYPAVSQLTMTVFTRRQSAYLNFNSKCAFLIKIRKTIFWTVCTPNHIAMRNLKCTSQMMVQRCFPVTHLANHAAKSLHECPDL